MARRSSRLVSGGYYHSDEESDSSSVTNISYRENPVKVFKKKSGSRRSASRTSSNGSSASPGTPVPEPGLTAGRAPTLSPLRSVSFAPTAPTPRPALTPSSSQNHTSKRCHSLTPERSPSPGHCSAALSPLQHRSKSKERSKSGADSSGYSSAEGPYRKPSPATSTTSSPPGSTGPAFSPGYRRRISDAFSNLMNSASVMAAHAHRKVLQVTSSVKDLVTWDRTKKVLLFALLLIIILMCIWLLLPLFTSFVVRTQPEFRPGAIPTSVVDPRVVSAAVQAEMQDFLVELQLKQEQLLCQLNEKHQLDVDFLKAKIEATDSDMRRHLELEVSGLEKQMEYHQTDSRSAAASLSLKIQTLETQNAKLSQELSSMQATPAPDSAHNQLTPELQLAMEKWLTDRIKEQEASRVKLDGTECGRPEADRMPDFALETQGASIVSTRCSETYRIRSACITLFGFPLWYPSESPRTVIQGYPVLLPGKCWAFHGVQGTLVISLSHPIRISHVTLDHLPRYNSPTGHIDSAPKDFEVYGLKNDTEEGALLGAFFYDEDGESTQTFKLPNPSDEVYRFVELRVLSNWGHMEYTCLYRFRVHGTIAYV
ncbi:SUN domain-containing protein 1-like [Poeciliopsis prolifica]|nr:SUN domain-containing protein 1-like [Poeciliopsis prolifica]XP_054896843.1 SUN domain-containing protein 1-like [Poeciliopsis prolifica]